MTTKPLKKGATYDDLVRVPEHYVAEIFDGELYALPKDAYLTLAPDWICEVPSPSTESIDRGQKLRIYAREGVAHAWLVDPLRHTLEVLALEAGSFEPIAEHHGNASIHARPFDAIELEPRVLWS